MARTPREAPVHQEGVIPPEFAVNRMKFVRDGETVRIWAYTVLTDPLAPRSPPQIVPVVVLSISAKAFDAFIAEGMIKVVAKIADGADVVRG